MLLIVWSLLLLLALNVSDPQSIYRTKQYIIILHCSVAFHQQIGLYPIIPEIWLAYIIVAERETERKRELSDN